MRGSMSSLPRWARLEIERLERSVEHWKALVAVGPENSDTFADPYSDAPRPLGIRPTVEFHLGPNPHNDRVRVTIEETTRGRWLSINGSDALRIRPGAANAIEIRTERL